MLAWGRANSRIRLREAVGVYDKTVNLELGKKQHNHLWSRSTQTYTKVTRNQTNNVPHNRVPVAP